MRRTPPITRRDLLAGSLCVLVGAEDAGAAAPHPFSVEDIAVAGLPVRLRHYAGAGSARRPAVLMLHGSKGLDANREAYDRYARDLAGTGIDCVLFSYFDQDEATAINEAPDSSSRQKLYARSIDRWVALVRSIASLVQKDVRNSGHVGLFGFSLGGFVAVAAASRPMFSALTVFYAGLPTFYDHPVSFLPPLLAIHGDADRAVPFAEGERLVLTAKRLGGVAELALFPGEGHGFDLVSTNRDAAKAQQRAIAFAARWLA